METYIYINLMIIKNEGLKRHDHKSAEIYTLWREKFIKGTFHFQLMESAFRDSLMAFLH